MCEKKFVDSEENSGRSEDERESPKKRGVWTEEVSWLVICMLGR